MNEARQWLTEDLESVAPGPELASLLASVDRGKLSGRDRVRLLQARHRLVAHLQAEWYADMYAISRDEPATQPDPLAQDEPAEPYPWASTEISFALRWTSTAASIRLEHARRMIEDLPMVADALRAGQIDVPKALALCEEVCALDLAMARRIVDRLISKAPDLTTGQLRAKLRRLVIAADPAAVADRAGIAAKGRGVSITQEHHNLASISGYDLLPHRVAAGYERLTAIARAAKAAGDRRRMDELRADVMLDLLIGEGVAVGGPITHGGLDQQTETTDVQECYDVAEPGNVARETVTPTTKINRSATDTAKDTTKDAAWPPDAATPWPLTPADPDLLDPAADPPVTPRIPAIRGHHIEPELTNGYLGPAAQLIDTPKPATAGEPVGACTENPHLATEEDEPPEGDPTIDPEHERLRPYWLAGFDQLATHRPTTCHHRGQNDQQCRNGLPGENGGNHENGGNGENGQQRGPMPAPRRGVIDLQMSLTTLMGLDDLPAELSGFGPLLADIARQVVEQRPDLQLRFSVHNEIDALLVHGTTKVRPDLRPPGRRTRRRPTAAVAALVRARNRTCAAPGCRVPSLRCELDHILAWSDNGESEPDNLDPSCPRHHRFKHSPGCQLVTLNPGTFGWQTPLGMQYLGRPDPPLYDDHRYIHPPRPGDP